MNILFLTNTYPDCDSSYRGIFIKQLALRLQQEGWGVTVVTPRIYRGSPSVEEKGGIQVYRFPFFSGGKLLIEYKKIPYLRMVSYFLSGALFAFYGALKHRCLVIHVHWAIPTGLIGIVIGAFLRRPLVVTVHGSDFAMASGGSSFLRKLFVLVCRRASHITVVSEGMRTGMAKMGVAGEKMSVSPMGVDDRFFAVGIKRQSEVGADPKVVLSNRNLEPLYNVVHLIRAIPGVLKDEPQTTFLIAGEGREKARLEKEAAWLKITPAVNFLGRMPHEEMPDLLARTDIYVSTSLSDGTSVSLLEAMATGAFPIATDIPANREWIRDGENGFLVPPGDEVALATSIVSAIRQTGFSKSVGGANRELVGQKAHIRHTIRDLMTVYERLTGLMT